MNTTRSSQSGVSTIITIILVVTIMMVGSIGLALAGKRTSQPSADRPAASQTLATSDAPDTANTATPPITPTGYTTFDDQGFYFSFAYPSSYGELVKTSPQTFNNADIQMVYASEAQKNPAISTLNGGITATVYKQNIYSTYSRTYGPTIRLEDGRWIVTEPSEYDVVKNKKGDEYRDANGKTIVATQQSDVTVYSLDSGDEGCSNRRYAFLSYGRLVVIGLPSYCSGGYGNAETPSAAEANAYGQLLSNVLDSIWIGK